MHISDGFTLFIFFLGGFSVGLNLIIALLFFNGVFKIQ